MMSQRKSILQNDHVNDENETKVHNRTGALHNSKLTKTIDNGTSTPFTTQDNLTLVEVEDCKTQTETWKTLFNQKIFSIEEENYIRLSILLTRIATKAVRQTFDKSFTPGTLRNVFSQNAAILTQKVKDFQHRLLFSKDEPDSTNFDAQLMICILEEFHKQTIVQLDESVLSGLRNIKKFRNEVLHSRTTDFSNICTIWDEITMAVKALVGDALFQECIDIRVATLKSSNEEMMFHIRFVLMQMKTISYDCDQLMNSNDTTFETKRPLMNEEDNFVRLYILMSCFVPTAVRKHFDNVENLQERLGNLVSTEQLTSEEYHQLQHSEDNSLSTKFIELSLMLRLFDDLGEYSVRDDLPTEEHVSIEACLCTINYFCKRIEDNSENGLKDDDFDIAWNSVCKAITFLSGGEMTQQCKCLRMAIIDEPKKELIIYFHLLQRQTKELKNKLRKCETNLKMRSENAKSKETIKIKEVDLWKKPDEKFENTKTADFIFQSLRENTTTCVIITGVPGRGKTTLARHSALLMQKQGYKIIPVSTPKEIREFGNHDEPTVFVVDDFCGKSSVSQPNIHQWENIFDDLSVLIGDRSKIIICCRLHIYRDSILNILKEMFTSSSYRHIDLELEKFSLTSQQICSVVERTANVSHYNVAKYSNIYPFLLLDVSSMTQPNASITISERGRLAYEHEMNALYQEKKQQFAALALVAIFNNHLEQDELFETDHNSEAKRVIDRTLADFGLQGQSRETIRDNSQL